MDWSEVDLSGEPVVILGWRPQARRLAAGTLDLHEDAFGQTRAIAEEVVTDLADRVEEPWEPNAAVEPGEDYLVLPVSALQPTARQADDPALATAAELLAAVLDPGALEELHPSDLADRHYIFYALVWEEGYRGSTIGFVSQYDPTVPVRAAKHYFRFDGTLQLMDPPDLAFKSGSDLIVTSEEIAVLNPTSFNRLFADVRTLLQDVPQRVSDLSTKLKIRMTAESRRAIERVCLRRPSYAVRLTRLAARDDLDTVTPSEFKKVLTRRQLAHSDFLDGNRIAVDDDSVPSFLDLIEGRLWEADFSGEARRAARWTSRR